LRKTGAYKIWNAHQSIGWFHVKRLSAYRFTLVYKLSGYGLTF